MTPEQTITLLMPVMLSLQQIHRQWLIHRDISPDNIMLINGKVKLLDFGAARDVSSAANQSISVMLKPGYAPEEQYRSKGLQGPWTDVYALCATMYKCITGITPDDAAQRIYNDELKMPSVLGISISPVIEHAIMKGLSVLQRDRYQSVDELIDDFNGIGSIAGSEEKTVYLEQSKETPAYDIRPETKVMPVPPARTEAFSGKKSKKGLLIGILGGALFAVLVLLLIVLIGNGGNRDDEPNTTPILQPDETTSGEATTNSGETEADKVPNGNVIMSDNLFDFTFELEGVVYSLPTSYDKFVENGWTISTIGYSEDTKIAGESYADFEMVKNGRKITVYSYNLSGNARTIKDCKVGGIKCDMASNVTFSLAKNITCMSSAQEIITAFGAPNENKEHNAYTVLTYTNQNSGVSFNCYTEESGMQKYSSIEMINFVSSSDDITITNEDVPEYLSEYEVPDALGSDAISGIFQ